MSRLDELIDRLVPNGVPHKRLGEVGEFIRGNGLPKADLTESGVPAIHYGQIHTFYGTWARETKSFTTPAIAARLRRAGPGDLIIATTSEDDMAVAKATAWIGAEEVAVSGDAYIYRHQLDPRYVAYFFQSEQFRAQKIGHVSGTKVRRISGDALARIQIPVPPLEVQREIVRILDHFTELEARRRQYLHFREVALTLGPSIPRTALSDVCIIRAGQPVNKVDISNAPGPYPVINSGRDALGYIDRFNTVDDPVGITSRGAGVGSVTWTDRPYFRGNLNYSATIRDPGVLVPRFLFHWLLHDQKTIQALCTYDGIPALNKSKLETLLVPIPSMAEQRAIVETLDKFDALVNDISIGLPAELAARRKQYEYYRDTLLTFEEVTDGTR